MRKAFSVMLAALLMLAMCVPAFAATGNKQTITPSSPEIVDGAQSLDTWVHTDTTGTEYDGGKYTVTIPAETIIKWGTGTTTLSYTVSAQLMTNQYLTVSVAGTNLMTEEHGLTLAYTLDGALQYQSTPNQVVKNAKSNFTVNIDGWDDAVISTYQDNLTFTVKVEPNN